MTHTCQICNRSGLNLVEGMLEDHLHEDLSGECPGSGTDRYVREEGKVVDYDGPTPITDAFMTLIDDSEIDLGKVESQLKTFERQLATEQARIRALREAARKLIHGRILEDNEFTCIEVEKSDMRSLSDALAALAALAAYDTAAPLPPDAVGDGELLDWLERQVVHWPSVIFGVHGGETLFFSMGCEDDFDFSGHHTLRDAIRAAIRAEEGK